MSVKWKIEFQPSVIIHISRYHNWFKLYLIIELYIYVKIILLLTFCFLMILLLSDKLDRKKCRILPSVTRKEFQQEFPLSVRRE
jgi:hypothetical protein